MKREMPFETLPVLEVDGMKLGGTLAIAQFLAEKSGLAADGDAWCRAQLNSICDAVLEVTVVLSRYWSEEDPSLRARKKKEILEKQVPKRLARINKRIEEGGSSAGYVCCNQLTYADFFIKFLFCDVLTHVYPPEDQYEESQKYPAVSKLCETLHQLPHLQKHTRVESHRDVGAVWAV